MRRIARCFYSLIAAGFCLSSLACTPASHVDSPKKIATATSARLTASVTTSPSTRVPQHRSSSDSSTTVTSEPFLSPSPPLLAPGQVPSFIDCVGSPTTRPRTISLLCTDKDDRVVDITWSSWSSIEAVGTGFREMGKTPRTPVTITLRNPLQSAEAIVFADVYVDGAMIPL